MIRLILCLILIALPARAEMPAGHDDPRFRAAVEAWLDGEDQAISTIYDLAGKGNVAALILYSRMTKHARIGEAKRLDYFWLDFAKDSPLGLAFGISWETLPQRTSVERVETFLALGEHREAANRLRRAASEARSAEHKFAIPGTLIERVLGPQLDPLDRFATMFALWDEIDDSTLANVFLSLCDEANRAPSRHGAILRFCEAVSAGDSETEAAIRAALLNSRATADPFGRGRKIVRDWLDDLGSIAHSRLCRRICPDEVGACAIEVWYQTSEIWGFLAIGSPVETLVSQRDYVGSRRSDLELWDFLSARRDGFLQYGMDTGWAEAPSCLLRAVDSGRNPWRQTSE
ncbi:MAG: hypothetical protein AAGH68_07330 [Pseudomonadota bacterium]